MGPIVNGEHDPSRPASQSDDDAGHVVQLLEFVFFITVVAIGSAALTVLVGDVGVLLVALGAVAAVFKWGSRDKGPDGGPDRF